MRNVLVVVGTRPNFIKVTRFKEVAAAHGGIDVQLVHTGQHFDAKMADVFFAQFGLTPDHWLEVPPGSPTSQMAGILVGLEQVATEQQPDLMLVVGDVNSTLAGALTANKMGIRLGHLESGLRSMDRGMPEEINRILTDQITDHYFITEQSGIDHLLQEGRPKDAMHLVGNTMIDTLVKFEDRIQASPVLEELGLSGGDHVLMTIHRPATVDDPQELAKLVDLIALVAKDHPVVFPVHPRTTNNLKRFGLHERLAAIPGLILGGPMDYFAFQKLIATCAFVITDSGGIQEETTYRRVPCLTLRPNTERPVTITRGTNELITFDLPALQEAISRIQAGTFKKGEVPPLWDGHATERVVEVLGKVL
ncbi:MAG: UDP-N-acetylglucosamine 2-epimerase (non-hydrolyzing) [Flavobacteriales bacterium]|nr:UDP-N-acetylglucosamine 2-epimerase (non-hydrolyzing) [Flavobacteriales bacterium]MCB9193623.1 UDP-N-acetylglucosamine 2-epimerase (non-hydrolyzing) [Flavobacteriales bacterium]